MLLEQLGVPVPSALSSCLDKDLKNPPPPPRTHPHPHPHPHPHHTNQLTQTIAAALSYKSPFVAPLERQDEMETAKRALAASTAAATAAAAAAAGKRGAGKGSRGGGRDAKQPPLPQPAAAVAAAQVVNIAAGQQSDHFVLIAAFEMWRHARSTSAGEAAKVRIGRALRVHGALLGKLLCTSCRLLKHCSPNPQTPQPQPHKPLYPTQGRPSKLPVHPDPRGHAGPASPVCSDDGGHPFSNRIAGGRRGAGGRRQRRLREGEGGCLGRRPAASLQQVIMGVVIAPCASSCNAGWFPALCGRTHSQPEGDHAEN